MVTYGFPDIHFHAELLIANEIGASVVEILPDWARLPDPRAILAPLVDHQLTVHSAHGCWGQRTIRAHRVDLGSPDKSVSRDSIDDLKTCADWLSQARGTYLVVHPGGFSDPAEQERRTECLTTALLELADHARHANIIICVENMPPGVHPGSSMSDLHAIVSSLDHPALALALDTGHANLTSSVAHETAAAGNKLATTHVHDNNGRQDSHEPPGHGTIDWNQWATALDQIDYHGPVMLECIKRLRQDRSLFRADPLRSLAKFSPIDASR
jgi:sugar phosphate isomerase/epimerase